MLDKRLERYPVNITDTAKMFTASKFPQDPIAIVEGHDLPGLEGALVHNDEQGEWAIFFNLGNPSKRRIRFTLAHEFGHYLLHRRSHPEGFQCALSEIPLHDRQMTRLEQEADTFAANFLMPIEDFQRQISADEFTDLNMIGCSADRYGVSLTAAVRQWLRYTRQRAVLAVSRDGFVLWSEASTTAKKAGTWFPNIRKKPFAIPAESLAAKRDITNYPKDGVPMPKGVWFKKHEVLEMGVHSDQYEIVITLLMLDFDKDPVGGWE
ncbi:MAG: ImmA/IrrE family metallo-endopeptidase [Magnetococcales bacterium]|nr:ImmA/IrrE family metallo-endopeptidase [Magnetococcales bacterium]